MTYEPAQNVDPAFYRLIGELTGEIRGLKESLDFRTRQLEVQLSEIKADMRVAQADSLTHRAKMVELENYLSREVNDIRDRVGTIERRVDMLDAKIERTERPIEELAALRVRILAWFGAISATGGVIWIFVGHRVVAILQWLAQSTTETH
jgi:hypothetical protein